ncbi:hypothetical protein [Bacterioplanoides sp.]|uniref:hypothetical protein n=1 Tax=Bacterioplanoides sp. TaxID=2066072 RepID=UPI003B5B7D63
MDALNKQPAPALRIASPIPMQAELIQIDGHVALMEYQAAFKNEFVHLPEVALRYMVWLVLSDEDKAEIHRFALQIRNELNAQGLERFKRAAAEVFKAGKSS